MPDAAVLDTLVNSVSLPAAAMSQLDGVYLVRSGASRFGDTVVLKHDGRALSMFCQRNSAYMVLKVGLRNNTILCAGYWRFAQGSQTGAALLSIADSSAQSIVNGHRPERLMFRGSIGASERVGEEQITLEYLRALHGQDSSQASGQVLIIAHRGGGRNSDRLPFSENSVELIKYASKLGAQGVEIDVRLTRDSVPVLYHDENLNTRLVDGEYMVGPIGNYSLAQLRTLARLKNGELIPTLQEVLDAVVDSTDLRAVWLDIKDVAEVQNVIPMQQAALKRAAALHAAGLRDSLEIFFGLATDDIYQAFLHRADHASVSSVCELGVDQVLAANSAVYGARWTLGGLESTLSDLHARGKRAYVWTLDQPEFIASFLATTQYDGILTNYPTVVAYYNYVRP